MKLTCKRCSGRWTQRGDNLPVRCPKCGSYLWNSVPKAECPTCSACSNCHPRTAKPVPSWKNNPNVAPRGIMSDDELFETTFGARKDSR